MSKKLIYLTSFALVLSLVLTSTAKADLIGHWTFDEGAGNIAFDSSDYGNDGTLEGNPQWVEGIFGGALDLDGNDDYVAIDGIADDLTDNNFTVTAWIKTTQSGDGNVIGSNDTGSGHQFIFGVDGGNLLVEADSVNTYPPRYQRRRVAFHSVRQGWIHRIRIHRWRAGRHRDTLGQSVRAGTVVNRTGMGR